MSSRTQRWRERLPWWQPRPPQPVLIDGLEELERAYQVMSLLADLEEGSQARILNYVERICLENAERRHAFTVANDQQPTTKPAAE